MVKAVYHNLCPNCMGPISSIRLEMGLPCSSCLPQEKIEKIKINGKNNSKRFSILARNIVSSRAGVYVYLREIFTDLSRFESFFKKYVGKGFWGLQRTWALRLLSGESFAITAPTGVGKTTLLLTFAVYMAAKNKRVYILVPTDSLVVQAREKLEEIIERTGKKIKVVAYSSREGKKKKEEKLSMIEKGDYDVLLTTTSFLSRRHGLLEGVKFDLILVDDADSLLKNSKNIDRILKLVGFEEKDIENAYRLIKSKREYMIYRINNDTEKAERKLLEIEELQLAINESKASKKIGQLAIASATGRQAGLKPKLFRELLDFEIGGIHDYMRNIIESYHIDTLENNEKKAIEIIKKLGKGGLVFVSRDKGALYARRLVELLRENGVKAELAIAGKRVINKLVSGEADVLVGVASYYGVIVRGIDLPTIVKYAVFMGIPKNRISLEKALESPRRLLQVMAYLLEKSSEKIEWLVSLQKRIERLSYGESIVLRIALANKEIDRLEGRLGDIGREITKAIKWVIEKAEETIPMMPGSKISLGTGYLERGSDGKIYFVTPDPMTYIQASGRTSRFLDNRMTLGLTIIFEEDTMALDALSKKIKNYVLAFKPIPLESIDLEKIKELLLKSRTTGEGSRSFKPAKSVMIVVESPNKARTIAGYFGRPSRRRLSGINVYETPIIDPETLDTYLAIIVATKGHMYDLVSDNGIGVYGVIIDDKSNEPDFIPVFTSIKKCLECGHSFTTLEKKCPRCGEKTRIKTSHDIVHALRKLALEAQEVLIATDPDTEGEKIAWDVSVTIKPFNSVIKRIEFHEVTKEAILQAIREPRKVNINRVSAQIVRRVTDRWIGFSLSQKLWTTYDKRWLGAGRVQTPVLGWIINRFESWKENKGYWVTVRTGISPTIKLFVKDKEEAENIFNYIMEKKKLAIKSFSVKKEKINPPPPFTTDDLIYTAGRTLGYTAPYIMRLAQQLFESGLITYHRTDSTRISAKGMGIAKEYFGKIGKPELYYPRSWGSGGAHEAIRPIKPLTAEEVRRGVLDGSIKTPINLSEPHYKLYDLIFKRFMASQARPTTIRKTRIVIEEKGHIAEIEAITGIEEEGFLSVLGTKIYPEIEEKVKQKFIPVTDARIFKGSRIPLYTQGDIVKAMKEKGLGRPSTYSKIVESIRRHGYIILSKKMKYLVPTKTGVEVYGFLTENYGELVNEARTVMLEHVMDEVEEGRKSYRDALSLLLQEITSLGLLEMEGMKIESILIEKEAFI